MRKLILFLAAVAAASPAGAATDRYRPLRIYGYGHHGAYRGPFAEARALILGRNLLTPEQLRCAALLRGDRAAGQVTQVRVVRRVSPTCPVVADASPFLFDLFIDNASGSFQWTPGGDAAELEELPYLGDARRARLTGE